ncbi:tetraspanin-17-like [Xenentodon cancila]
MGKINGCLKCLFIFFNVVFVMSEFGGPGLGWLWVIAIGVLGIACLGIFASCAEKALALKIFAGFMGTGMIIMLIFGIIMVVIRNKAKDDYQTHISVIAKAFTENSSTREILKNLQEAYHCCGLHSAKDWASEIPESCRCTSPFQCKLKPQGYSGPTTIYAETCSETILSWINLFFNVTMGILFGFAITALMGLLISLLMVHQIKRHDSAGGPSIAMKGY